MSREWTSALVCRGHVALLLTGGLLFTGCVTNSDLNDYRYLQKRQAKLALSKDENARRVGALAGDIEQAYRSAPFLSFEAECIWPHDIRLRAQVAMAPESLKTVGFIDDTRVLVFTMHNGLFEEYKAEFKGVPAMTQMHLVGDAAGPDDIELLAGIEEYGCPMGGFYHTWLGPQATKPPFLVERTRAGDYLGKMTLEGKPCALVLCQPGPRYGGTELFYIGQDGFVIRWDTFWKDEKDTIPLHRRTRRYRGMSTDPLPPETWKFEVLKAEEEQGTKAAYIELDEHMHNQEWSEALRTVDRLLAKLPHDIGLLKKKFHVLAVRLKDDVAAEACGELLFAQVKYAPGFLNEFAWALLTEDAYGGRHSEMALKWSQRANELTDCDSWPLLDTLARASFETGDVERAVHFQKRAIELSGGKFPELEATLEKYEAEAE